MCVDCVSAGDKGVAFHIVREHRCCGDSVSVRETRVLGVEHRSSNGFLEILFRLLNVGKEVHDCVKRG